MWCHDETGLAKLFNDCCDTTCQCEACTACPTELKAHSLMLPLLLSLILCEPPQHARFLKGPAIPTGPVVREIWYNRVNAQGKLGWLQMLSYEVKENEQTLIKTVVRDHLRYLRSGDPYTEDSEQYSIETKDGTTVEVGYRTSLGKNQDLVIRGRPQGNRITLEVLDHAGRKVIYQQEKPWNPAAKGLLYQDKLLVGKDLSSGKTYSVHGFLNIINEVTSCTYVILGRKQMPVAGVMKELVEVEQRYPKEIYIDPSHHYLDPATGEAVISTEDNSLFDLVTHERVSREKALEAFPGNVKDKDAPVTIDKPIPMSLFGLPGRLRIAVEMSQDDHPEQVFLNTRRQQFVKKEGKRAEFRLAKKELEGVPVIKEAVPGPDYLSSNFYIRSDDALVKKHAQDAIRDATEPRHKMERITRWVSRNVKGDYETGFITADEVARTMEGDCTEMGILAAAMGRAQGIPTRICFGLVYDPENKGFAGHLWTEAWIEDNWLPFDPTGVLDSIGAAYLRIDGYSMKDVLNPDEMAGVRRGFAGRMKVFLLETK